MDISSLQSLLRALGLTPKQAEKPVKPVSQTGEADVVQPSEKPAAQEDSISISSASASLEGMVKITAMEVKEQVNNVREDKVEEMKAKISSGTYQVDSQELARSILQGRDIYQELR
jgi:flagellar biosynthesis anti-sigma factor FlgM